MGWLCDLVNNTGFQVFGGAFFGALYGYGFARFLAWQETNARRFEVLALLDHQFTMLDEKLEPFDPTIGRYLDPVDVHAASLILDAKTLNYYDDSYLIRCLDMLRQSVDRYNEYARFHNQSALLAGLDVEQRRRSYEIAELKYGNVIQGRQAIYEILVIKLQEEQRKWWYRAWRWRKRKVILKTNANDSPSVPAQQ